MGKNDYRPPVEGDIELQSLDLVSTYYHDDVVVYDEILQWMPRRPEAEYRAFKMKVIDEGIKEPLDVWMHEDQMILIDGFTRRQVAVEADQELGKRLQFRVRRHEFNTIDEVKLFMVEKQQIERRNLSPYQSAYFNGYLALKVGIDKTEGMIAKAEKIGVSARTISRYICFYTGIEKIRVHNPILADALRTSIEPLGISLTDIGRIGSKVDESKLKGVKTVDDLKKILNSSKPSSKVDKQVEKVEKRISSYYSKFIKKPNRENLQSLKDQLALIIDELEAKLEEEMGA